MIRTSCERFNRSDCFIGRCSAGYRAINYIKPSFELKFTKQAELFELCLKSFLATWLETIHESGILKTES
jgi:hypothetical protein